MRMDWAKYEASLAGCGESNRFTAETPRKALTAENAERAEFFETCFPLCSEVKGSG